MSLAARGNPHGGCLFRQSPNIAHSAWRDVKRNRRKCGWKARVFSGSGIFISTCAPWRARSWRGGGKQRLEELPSIHKRRIEENHGRDANPIRATPGMVYYCNPAALRFDKNRLSDSPRTGGNVWIEAPNSPVGTRGVFRVTGGRAPYFRNLPVGEAAAPGLPGERGGGRCPPRVSARKYQSVRLGTKKKPPGPGGAETSNGWRSSQPTHGLGVAGNPIQPPTPSGRIGKGLLTKPPFIPPEITGTPPNPHRFSPQQMISSGLHEPRRFSGLSLGVPEA